MDLVYAIFLLAGIPPLVWAGAAFVGQMALKQLAARDLAKYKQELSNEAALFKAQLDHAAFEHQTRFSIMHGRRVDVIEKVYGHIQEARRAMELLVGPLNYGKENIERKQSAALAAFDAAQDYFLKNQIYLSAATANKTGELLQLMRLSFIDFQIGQTSDGGIVNWHKAWKQISEQLPPVLQSLEAELRATLGSDGEAGHTPSDR